MTITKLLASIPAIVWSGLLASFVTLSGVMLSNWGNTRRLLLQLRHDADQKRQDRLAALHREVYLTAVEELAKANSFLGKISQIDPAKENIGDGFSGLFAACAKAQLIAQPEASKLLGELIMAYGQLIMRLIGHVMPVHDLNRKIRLASDFLERNQAEARRVLDEIKLANESGAMTPARFEALDRSFQHAQEMAESFSAQRDDLWVQHGPANREFNVALLGEMRAIGPIQARTMAALRSELGLETDMVGYMQRMEENMARIDEQLQVAMGKMSEG